MLDAEGGKGLRNIEKIKIENDLGMERWYKANKFILYAEAVAYSNGKVAESAPENALEDATPNGAKLIMEIDAVTPPTTRKMLEIEKSRWAGLAAGIGLNYGA